MSLGGDLSLASYVPRPSPKSLKTSSKLYSKAIKQLEKNFMRIFFLFFSCKGGENVIKDHLLGMLAKRTKF